MSITDKKRDAIDAKIQRLSKLKVESSRPKRKQALQKRVDILTEKLSS